MSQSTVAVLMPGDMGHAVGRALREGGRDVITCVTGRSDATRDMAVRAGMRLLPAFTDIAREADLILSILPPAAAAAQAQAVCAAMQEVGRRPVFVDCNAISPKTVQQIGDTVGRAGAAFLDAGIIGLAPGKGTPPRFYVSGADPNPLMALDGLGIEVRAIGETIGQASALKMTYAGLTKGTWTLQTAVLLAARQTGVLDDLLAEFGHSQKAALAAMRGQIPRLPADSARWIGEMEEIAATFADAGVTPDFHTGAAEIFRVLASTPLAEETRETIDASRTLEQALAVYCDHLGRPDEAD
ncbi:MAG: DUF1932 domain-containing protein [Pseudomonadota bacterium]